MTDLSKPAKPKTVYIVGAGFSFHAGLPLASAFTGAILDARKYKSGPSRLIVDYLSRFASKTFDHSKTAGARFWPDLEDIFTCVDLSANSGHHLGGAYSPAELRTVRRAILSRTIRMLDQKYEQGQKEKSNLDRRAINRFFSALDPDATSFISMNWDTVIERKIGATWPNHAIDYQCDAITSRIQDLPDPLDFSSSEYKRKLAESLKVKPYVRRDTEAVSPTIPVIKIHGSINWLYCDNCRRLFWFDPADTTRIAEQLLTQDDLQRMGRSFPKSKISTHQTISKLRTKERISCICPGGVALGTRIATFSYRKALEFSMFQKSWFSAEKLLLDAARWVFIGYSMPSADFEFKYLLKRMQLSRGVPPEIVVISGGKKDDLDQTLKNYRKFFGKSIDKSNFIRDGLRTYKP